MKAIISPAKTLDLKTPYPSTLPWECPLLEKQAKELISILKKLSPDQISQLMSVSPKLADLNYNRFQDWKPINKKSQPKEDGDVRPAIYMFQGDVYQGINPHTLTPAQIKKMDDFTYILSGLYGVLRPLNLIHPYRLEMGTQIPFPAKAKNLKESLYSFWGDQIATLINRDFSREKKPILVNLASEEYFTAIKNYLSPNIHIIHPVFLDQVKGSYKQVSFYAKKARGLMVRFMISNSSNPSHLKRFNLNKYYFSEKETQKWYEKKFFQSSGNSTLVFLRDH